jgi:uncharacterized damage-inducible protein DinB
MHLQHLLSNQANANQWANEAIVTWLSQKTEADLYKAIPSSYPSIVLTLNHILAVQEFWYAIITQTPLTSARYLMQDPEHAEVFSQLVAQSALLSEYIAGLSEADLLEVVPLDTPWAKGNLPRYEFIQHVLTHSTYHRGQVVNIGRSLGYTDAPMTDYNFYNLAVLKRG